MVPTAEEYGCTPDEYGSTSKNLHLHRIPYISYIYKYIYIYIYMYVCIFTLPLEKFSVCVPYP